jgi:hypothetical protein
MSFLRFRGRASDNDVTQSIELLTSLVNRKRNTALADSGIALMMTVLFFNKFVEHKHSRTHSPNEGSDVIARELSIIIFIIGTIASIYLLLKGLIDISLPTPIIPLSLIRNDPNYQVVFRTLSELRINLDNVNDCNSVLRILNNHVNQQDQDLEAQRTPNRPR